MEGGNDYPLAKVMNNRDDCYVFQAGEPSDKNGYKETQKILEERIKNEK
jgi:phosphomannomutase